MAPSTTALLATVDRLRPFAQSKTFMIGSHDYLAEVTHTPDGFTKIDVKSTAGNMEETINRLVSHDRGFDLARSMICYLALTADKVYTESNVEEARLLVEERRKELKQ
jgi:hypothetical protein